MTNPFTKSPVATLVAAMTALLAVLVYLQGTGLITGQAAVWVGVAVGVLQVLLGLYARSKATPVADPKDDQGRALVPLQPTKRESWPQELADRQARKAPAPPPPNSF